MSHTEVEAENGVTGSPDVEPGVCFKNQIANQKTRSSSR